MDTQAQAYWQYVEQKITEYNQNGKPTIALFCESYYPFYDGVVEVTTNYARHLQQNYNVVMLAPRTKKNYYQKDYLVLLCHSWFWKKIHYPVAMPGSDRRFKQALKKLRIDLVHIHGPFIMGHFGVKYAKKHHLPVVATFHTQFKRDFLLHLKWEPLTRPLVHYITRCFRRCHEVWTMNEANVKILQSYGYHGATRIIPNGTDFIPGPQHTALLPTIDATYHLPAATPILMFCGRIIANKNIFLIADALKILQTQGFNFQMLFVGNGLDFHKLQKYVQQIALEHVTFTDKILDRDRLGAIYQRADLLLFPSVYDTDGLVKYEAAAFHTPTLLVANSPAAIGVTDQHNGYLTTPDANQIAAKITDIFAHPQTLATVKENCHTELYHHWRDITADITAAYAQLLTLDKK